jgi:hypothetical protein
MTATALTVAAAIALRKQAEATLSRLRAVGGHRAAACADMLAQAFADLTLADMVLDAAAVPAGQVEYSDAQHVRFGVLRADGEVRFV